MHPTMMIVTRAELKQGALPRMREPVEGRWYSGESVRGTGAIARYDGYGAFRFGDDAEADMTVYDHLVEHWPPGA